ncbi:MAG: hypothetical protein KF765_12465 [Parvibaculaceae bacterium]|nr:hypothetical protein [Parvibaculaceae bacterium]
MKSLAALALAAFIAVGAAAPAAAAVETGAQLVSACRNLIENGHAEGSSGEPCKQFLIGLIMPQQETLTMGEPFRAERLGPNQDQKACFDLPNQLTYRQFAQHVLTYAERQPDMTSRPAHELAVRALEANYPCDPVYLQ